MSIFIGIIAAVAATAFAIWILNRYHNTPPGGHGPTGPGGPSKPRGRDDQI